jgi:hypothetical protein
MFDVVVPIGPHDQQIAKTTLDALGRFEGVDRVFIVTQADAIPAINADHPDAIAVDERDVLKEVQMHQLRTHLRDHSADPNRAAWYYQQFLKMAFAQHPSVSDHYLIWDADTVPLRPLSFFDASGRILVAPSNEHAHAPYFDTIKPFGLSRQVGFSFVSEHLMVRTSHMLELLDVLARIPGRSATHWVWNIMDSVEPVSLAGSGFSEFETYGNFVAARHPDAYAVSRVPSFRFGAKLYGHSPNRYDLYELSRDHAFASFETWNSPSWWKTPARKARSFLRYWAASVTGIRRRAIGRSPPIPLEAVLNAPCEHEPAKVHSHSIPRRRALARSTRWSSAGSQPLSRPGKVG